MKLRNLIFALFLVIGAIGFTACTGDDGAPGEKGDPGEPGAQGEKGDPGDAGDSATTYAFLTSWGSETGTVACSDDLLTTTTAFPGPEELHSISDKGMGNLAFPSTPAELNAPITVTCGTATYGSAEVKAEGNPTVATDTTATGLIFVKTGRGAADPEMVDTPQNDIDPARRITTTKAFVGGSVHVNLNATGGSEEVFGRRLLHSNCGGDTAPPAIAGDWRGVKINTNVKAYRDGVQIDAAPDGDDAAVAEVNITTTKVCVRLDAHPGIVKCFIDIVDPRTQNSKMIAYYDAETGATSVMALIDGDETDTPPGTGASGVTNVASTLFGIPPATPGAAVTAGDLDADDTEQLCHLFAGGLM